LLHKGEIVMKKSLLLALVGAVCLSAPMLSQAQAMSAFSNPPPRVFVDSNPSPADPSYPGEEVAQPRHGFGSHDGVIERTSDGKVVGVQPLWNPNQFHDVYKGQ
jgi:hypothetical protein